MHQGSWVLKAALWKSVRFLDDPSVTTSCTLHLGHWVLFEWACLNFTESQWAGKLLAADHSSGSGAIGKQLSLNLYEPLT